MGRREGLPRKVCSDPERFERTELLFQTFSNLFQTFFGNPWRGCREGWPKGGFGDLERFERFFSNPLKGMKRFATPSFASVVRPSPLPDFFPPLPLAFFFAPSLFFLFYLSFLPIPPFFLLSSFASSPLFCFSPSSVVFCHGSMSYRQDFRRNVAPCTAVPAQGQASSRTSPVLHG